MLNQTKIFIMSLIGAGWLYFPAMLIIGAMPDTLLPPDREWAYRPEKGLLPFAMLWAGILVSGLIMWRSIHNSKKASGLSVWVKNGLIWSGIGAIVLILALPVLSRGAEGFLLWFNPGLWLIGLALLAWGLISGAILSLVGFIAFSNDIPQIN